MSNLLSSTHAWQISAVFALAMGLAYAAGYFSGIVWPGRKDRGTALKIEDATLAVLGLLLGFTFAMSVAKHDRRREMAVTDSNAIGDFYTTVCMLSEPNRSELQSLCREYLQQRIAIVGVSGDTIRFERALLEVQAMQDRMTQLVAAALRQPDTPPSAGTVLINTLNALTSSHAARLAAAKDRLPISVVTLLLCGSVIAVLLIGRQQGIAREAHPVATLVFVLLVSLVIFVILDLDQPTRGFISVSQEPFHRLLQSMTRQ